MTSRRYEPETAADLYAELQEAWPGRQTGGGAPQAAPDYRTAYSRLNRVFQRLLNEKTNFAGVRFNGPFAKTDYLLKEYRAPRHLQHSVNDARVRMRRLWAMGDDELRENYAHDLRAVCFFVSLIFQVPVPAVLQARFPKEPASPPRANARRRQGATLKASYLRIIVNSWDATYIYANADAEDAGEVKVFYGGKSDLAAYKEWDWSCLGAILRKGCQLNIVRPREEEGILYPELFIWEPDFLVDISAIAACFESYAASPLNHLINKLKPSPATQPIVLGNLASQFLDESLYSYPDGTGDAAAGNATPYAKSIKSFFRRNAISLLTASLGSDFHTQAQSQKRIIEETVWKKLPEMLQADGMHFDAREVMVEPSFFSEMLGLQGRMDFLQLDDKVLIEQKSGKAAYPETDPPRELEKHYVQLLLYMLLIRYNYHDKYERNRFKLFAFLLYSKYQNGLLPLGFAPILMFEAIKMRNGIAAAEYGYSRDGLEILRTLTADSLNAKHAKGPLWERFQRPQLDALLSPIRQATDLERAYYLRFMRFIETEHLMAKVGNQTKENSGFADKWLSTTEEKQTAGNIYCDLELLWPDATETGSVEKVVLRLTQRPDQEISNFRKGDIVILYPYAHGDEPDARRTMVFRATIERITAGELVLTLRATQTNAWVFWHDGRKKWAIEHDFFEASFASLYRGMHAFLSAPKERRDLLLLQRPPKTDATVALTGDYGPFNELALRVRQARELFLIIGPPGTGKTSFGLMTTLREELASGSGSVLLLSYTNRAVDEICGKLMESGTDFIRIGGRLTCEERCRPHLLDTIAAQCPNIGQLRETLAATRVLVGTTTAFNASINLFRLKQFALAIIDEASQILEPHLIGLLSATVADAAGQVEGCAIRKMVLIGDHKQLPAVVQQREEESVVDDTMLRAIHLTNCRLSLFERLLRQYGSDPAVTFMLTRQGRMHHDIARFPNEEFYQQKLREVPLAHQTSPLPAKGRGEDQMEDILRTRRVAFIAIPHTGAVVSDNVNTAEAQAIAAAALRIYEIEGKTFSPAQTVGIIVPYRNQIAEIRKHIDGYAIDALRDITIDTVERFQGSQRDYIIYGFTIQKHYQLSFLTSNMFEEDGYTIDRKLNVAMTRAREHLLIFGNPQLLAANATFARLMEFAKSHHCYYDGGKAETSD